MYVYYIIFHILNRIGKVHTKRNILFYNRC